MTRTDQLTMLRADGSTRIWNATTLGALNKSEEFLESALVNSPRLLNLESRRSGIRSPFSIFRQLSLTTPFGRTIYPDIVLLAASGHVIVVEVKKSVNPELRDRAVIAQIIDYAASFTALSEDDLVALFGSNSAADTWGDLVAELFPSEPDQADLADVLQERVQAGSLNLVIACDGIPPGMQDVIRGIAEQSSLEFDLDVVEVVPYVSADSDELLFVPSTRLSTEIVARTAVTVTYRQGDAQPSTTVETTSLEDIEENIRAASESKNWSVAETEAAFRAQSSPIQIEMLEFAKRNSHRGQITADSSKKLATFGHYIPVTRPDGTATVRMVYAATLGWPGIYFYRQRLQKLLSDEFYSEILTRLRSIFGESPDWSKAEVAIQWENVEVHRNEFQEFLLWLGDAADSDI